MKRSGAYLLQASTLLLCLFYACTPYCKEGQKNALPKPDSLPVNKDSSGQSFDIKVRASITATAKPIPGAVVYLVNNKEDWEIFDRNHTIANAENFRIAVSNADGNCTFDSIRPPSESVKHNVFPGHTGGYEYYMRAFAIDKTSGDTLYDNPGDVYLGSGLGNAITVGPTGRKSVTVVLSP